MSFLAPTLLVNNIGLFSLILGVIVLVIFSDTVNRKIVFPFADGIREAVQANFRSLRRSGWRMVTLKYLSEGLATAIFILYCYLGSRILAEYIFEPIMLRLKAYILIVVILLFLIINYIINDVNLRSRLMKH